MTALVHIPALVFASPRVLPRPKQLDGRIAVLDIAFAARTSSKVSFEKVTKPFIDELGERLAAWVDHHDHERHTDYTDDPRFLLCTKAEHGACPEMLTPDLVRAAGPVDTIVTHVDLDGLYAASKWILGGTEPYPGADCDARCVDTRIGKPGSIGTRIDRALRAKFRDNELKRAVVLWLVGGRKRDVHWHTIREAEELFEHNNQGTEALVGRYVIRGRVALVDASGSAVPYDKTELLLRGQEQCSISAVVDSGSVTFAAAFHSGWNLVSLFGLEGGMPTRVSISASRLDEALEAINSAPLPTRSAAALSSPERST